MTLSASLAVLMVKIPWHSLIPLTVILTILPFSTKVFITVLYVNARIETRGRPPCNVTGYLFHMARMQSVNPLL